MIRHSLCIAITLSAADVAAAQVFQPVYIPANLSGHMTHLVQQQAIQRESAGQQDARSSVRNVPLAKANAALSFTPSSARTRANLARFAEKARTVDPEGAAKMDALFNSTDVIALIDQRMRQTYGMRATNLADAYAVWWTSAWMGAKGRSDDATPGQMAMVKAQMSQALSSTAEVANASDADKQEMAEAMLIQAAMIGDTIDTYKSDPAMLAKARTAIAKGAREMGLDLSTMTLTDEGFVPARKTGAADSAPGTPEQALAANTAPVPTAANDTSPPYLLMAAAGGAGIGGVFLIGKMMGRRG